MAHFLNEIYRFTIQSDDVTISRFDTLTVNVQRIIQRRLKQYITWLIKAKDVKQAFYKLRFDCLYQRRQKHELWHWNDGRVMVMRFKNCLLTSSTSTGTLLPSLVNSQSNIHNMHMHCTYIVYKNHILLLVWWYWQLQIYNPKDL